MSEYTIINGQLYHHGIKGQKWGKRRYQNKDGSWTPAGRQRYSEGGDGQVKRSMKGNVHRVLAKNYDLNSKVYKNNNKALSSMNAQARNQQLKLAEKADQEAAAKRQQKEIKKYAQKGYAEDFYKGNKTVVGKAYDKFTGAHKIQADIKYDNSSDKANRARAEKYLNDKMNAKMEKQKYKETIKQYRKEINDGESFVGKVYNKLTDADKFQAEIRYAEEHKKKK